MGFYVENIIAVTNQKGGVGKTTTSISLASALALSGKKVLLVDLDPQASTSSGLGFPHTGGIYQALMKKKMTEEVIRSSQIKNLKLIPADMQLAAAEIELVSQVEREFFLKTLLKDTACQYDFVLIDTPPSLGLLTLNSLTAAGSFIIPLQCEYYALEGLNQLLETARQVKKNYNPSLKLKGILLTLFDARNSLSHRVEQEIRKHFKEQVFKVVVPRNVRLSEAPSFGQSIFQYEPHCAGAKAYEQLAGEVIFSGHSTYSDRPAYATT